ncbi:uncharacterized protein I303_100625 [Kwoniella dejecticola CBS 10117]|uniref:Uncharacterized protein n=1 Tax=Kwoniella dejecticola CBS 10117 TaxID=1296121 RepID=A0A1A6AFH7_9TREE|nr:uncharacterized protein I303_00628 [Kwoniella dejecticola CBS 10117]OBR88811.1 hypothetical protein I303_00628 [Kwoniella dejecticola CBS 10117]
MSSSAAAGTQNAATPQSSVAAASTSAAASSQAASTSAAASSAAASSAAANSSAPASSSAAAASSSTAASSSAVASSSTYTSTSASASSSSSSSRASTAALIDTTAAATSSSSKKGLSGGAIGGIVAGAVVGILVVLLLVWICKRKRRTRGEKVPPPPPMRHAQPSVRSRQPSMMGGGMSHQRRASTYSSLMAPPRPSSTFASHSRSPSSHINYPITTMASMNHDGSPPMPPSSASNSGSSDSPPLSTGANTPANALPSPPPGMKPTLAPIDTSLSRGGSASSEDLRGAPRPRRIASIDRLKGEVGGNGSDRAPSPASSRHPSESGVDYSRGNSPHTSMIGLPSPGRNSYSAPRSPNGYPRPGSMASLGSSRYLHVGPAGRAPHQGRPMQLTMPTLLGARPDENGDFFGQNARFDSGYHLGLDEYGRMRKISNRQYNEQDYQPSPIHTRNTSSNSLSNRSRQESDEGMATNSNANHDVPPIPETYSRNTTPQPRRSDVADPNVVLQRQ